MKKFHPERIVCLTEETFISKTFLTVAFSYAEPLISGIILEILVFKSKLISLDKTPRSSEVIDLEIEKTIWGVS